MRIRVEIYQDKKEEWRGRLVAGNGKILMATTEGYQNKGDCEKALLLALQGLKTWYEDSLDDLQAKREGDGG